MLTFALTATAGLKISAMTSTVDFAADALPSHWIQMRNARLTNALVEEFKMVYEKMIEGFTYCSQRESDLERRLVMMEMELSNLKAELAVFKDYIDYK